ncbi:UPP1-like protein [Mya arenaria]|uniref:UPP1-like protein n=1 Tax=Mya arenaria TaxID=6604 RepID=A0ABY7EC70_MYAAR|nr:UPP1-like protein [Mya arenaria]
MDIIEDNKTAVFEEGKEDALHTSNGHVKLHNARLKSIQDDHLYHIALSTGSDDLRRLFGDVKVVCFGGQATRMEKFAWFIAREFDVSDTVHNFAAGTDRYAVYKAGPVLSVSHGIGIPSLSIVFQEIVKLIYYAGCENVTFFRIGTCGGIGLEPGTYILGRAVERPAKVDSDLIRQLHACSQNEDKFKTVLGTTLCADDFYEGQGRMDGAFCEHEEEEKLLWLREIADRGVTNMEMESLGFTALCDRANIPGAVCCVTLVDRCEGDGITNNLQLLQEWQTYPQILVARYIRNRLDL